MKYKRIYFNFFIENFIVYVMKVGVSNGGKEYYFENKVFIFISMLGFFFIGYYIEGVVFFSVVELFFINMNMIE